MKRIYSERWPHVILAVFSLLCSYVACGPAFAADTASRGKKLAQACIACHGLDGNTKNATLYPNIAGQLPAYIALQLENFKSGERPNPVMQAFASPLSSEQMQDLGSYYGALRPKAQPSTDAELEAAGKKIFTSGSVAGAPACTACHGTRGQGQAPFPRISSQPASYLLEQLHVYRDAPAFKNPLAMQMKAVAVKVSEGEMRAVSAYLATLK
ncbi:c-type cytochrome [Undibacterium terreum]|uniref:Cytochrome c n=1 Tax=Undibacterium terreum TaxID=1224302 RepID=A0A916UJ00_9BURK|nr:c-type cytochrome [Undibacterium terreum]GGC74750.1 cytochrome c [Undibacterium terreum]